MNWRMTSFLNWGDVKVIKTAVKTLTLAVQHETHWCFWNDSSLLKSEWMLRQTFPKTALRVAWQHPNEVKYSSYLKWRHCVYSFFVQACLVTFIMWKISLSCGSLRSGFSLSVHVFWISLNEKPSLIGLCGDQPLTQYEKTWFFFYQQRKPLLNKYKCTNMFIFPLQRCPCCTHRPSLVPDLWTTSLVQWKQVCWCAHWLLSIRIKFLCQSHRTGDECGWGCCCLTSKNKIWKIWNQHISLTNDWLVWAKWYQTPSHTKNSHHDAWLNSCSIGSAWLTKSPLINQIEIIKQVFCCSPRVLC